MNLDDDLDRRPRPRRAPPPAPSPRAAHVGESDRVGPNTYRLTVELDRVECA